MSKINEHTEKEIQDCIKASNQLRAAVMKITQLAKKIDNDPQLASACGFNEGTDLDKQLIDLGNLASVKHAIDAPLHWAMRAGVDLK